MRLKGLNWKDVNNVHVNRASSAVRGLLTKKDKIRENKAWLEGFLPSSVSVIYIHIYTKDWIKSYNGLSLSLTHWI